MAKIKRVFFTMKSKLCKRCVRFVFEELFYEGIQDNCKNCVTQEEYFDYIQPNITKLMHGLSVQEKQHIIRECVKNRFDKFKKQLTKIF